jgi:hypothetical protein
MEWRRGQESNLSRCLHSDGGFEDREDHQAPFTLRRNCGFRIANCGLEEKTARLFELLDLANDRIEVGPVAGIEFGMEQFTIGVNFESAAAGRDEGKRFDAFAEFKNFGRQTDGLRRVVSNHAVFDRDFGLHLVNSFPMKMVGKPGGTVKGMTAQGIQGELRRKPAGVQMKRRPRYCYPRPPF